MGEKRNEYRILARKPEERDHWENQDVCGWTILKRLLKRQVGMVRVGLTSLRIGTTGGLLRTR
jgi:hypothetical protein